MTKTIVKRYLNQRHRGSEGFGFYIPKSNRLTHNTAENRILSLLRRDREASEVLFHHRFPTSTPNVRNACHPFSTKDYFENQYVVVHNGVVRNPSELRKQHEELGIDYISTQEDGKFNDSEALAFDIARYLEGQVKQLTASGSIAFIAIKRDKTGKPMTLFFGRNFGNPLKMKRTKFSITLSSEGEGEDVEPNKLYAFSYDTKQLMTTALTIPSYTTYSSPAYQGRSHVGNSGFRNPGYNPSNYEYSGGSVSKPTTPPLVPAVSQTGRTTASKGSTEKQYVDMAERFIEATADDFLADSGNLPRVALLDVEHSLASIKRRMDEINNNFDEEELLEQVSSEDLNLYLELEEKSDLYTEVIKYLNRMIDEEEAGNRVAGFRGSTQGAN